VSKPVEDDSNMRVKFVKWKESIDKDHGFGDI
jgi:hypothetical protein